MKSDAKFRYDIFVSYSHHDENWVRDWLIPRLESSGLAVCLDSRDFQPGAPSVTEMERAVRTSKKTLLIITPSYIKSKWTEFEAVMALTIDPGYRQRRVIPLILEDAKLPLMLSTLTYLDFSKSEIIDDQFERLVQTVGTVRKNNTHSRVLLIENESSWIKIARAVLENCKVDEVRTAAAGISKLESEPRYDLVLVNLNLTTYTEASGVEILEYIRDHCPSLPRIVISGKPVRGPIHSTLFEGYQITEFITKGEINISELRQLVRRILAPPQIGSPEQQRSKAELIEKLRQRYDDTITHVNDGLKALDVYAIRLRREVGENQAEKLTRPDREVLVQKRTDCKKKFDSLFSRVLVATALSELDEIEKEADHEW